MHTTSINHLEFLPITQGYFKWSLEIFQSYPILFCTCVCLIGYWGYKEERKLKSSHVGFCDYLMMCIAVYLVPAVFTLLFELGSFLLMIAIPELASKALVICGHFFTHSYKALIFTAVAATIWCLLKQCEHGKKQAPVVT